MRKIFLDENILCELRNHKNKDVSSIENYKNKEVKFIYDDIEDYLYITNHDKENKRIELKYNNTIYKISYCGFANCRFRNIIYGITKEFKIEIGTHYKDTKRDIIITDREYRIVHYKNGNKHNQKWYKYTCNKCGWTEGRILETSLLGKQKGGCSACCNKNPTPVLGINTIWDTDRWMCDLGVSEEDAKTHTHSSGDKIEVTCSDCGRKKEIVVDTVYRNKTIGCCCSDNSFFPEKLMISVLEQLKINFETQLTKTKFKWCDKYKYDFYFELNNEKFICEVNGLQHYGRGFSSVGGRTLEEEQENDKLKKELALQNGIKPENYIVIDCRKSTLEWIRDNDNGILNSKLAELFDLNDINWIKAEEFALSNRVKEVCDLWNSGIKDIKKLVKIMQSSKATIVKWLKKGNELNWCSYETLFYNSFELKKNNKGHSCLKPPKKVICITTNKIFDSITEASRYYNCSDSGISKNIYKKNNFCGKLCDGTKLKWMDFEQYKNSTKQDVLSLLKDNKNDSTYKMKKVICLTTNKIFDCITDASVFYNCQRRNISACCLKKQKSCGKLQDGRKLTWMYYEDYIKQNQLLIHNENLGQAI